MTAEKTSDTTNDLKTLERMWRMDSKDSPMNYIAYLATRVASWERYWNILKSRTELMKHNRKWRAFAAAARLKYLLLGDAARFEAEKENALMGNEKQSIENDNPRLAESLRNFTLVQEVSIPYIGSLLASLKSSPEFAVSYIKTHGAELVNWINLLKDDNKLKDELRRLVIGISGAEAAEINKCIADLEAWASIRVGNDVQFFQNRVKAYIGGGKLEGREFLGLGKFFKDGDLIIYVKESAALRMLLTYQRQLEWFKNTRIHVAYAVKNPGWEGFRGPNGFYYNFKKGKNYLAVIERRFGNHNAAEELEQAYAKGGEVPILWLPYIDDILAKLKSPSYVNEKVILAAAEDLIGIFSRRKDELEKADIAANLNELTVLLRRLFKEAVRMSKNVKAYEELLVKELELLKKETEAEKADFINALLDHGELVIKFVEENALWVDTVPRIINSLNVGYIYLTSKKVQVLRRRVRRQISPYSFELERIRNEDDKARQITALAIQKSGIQAESLRKMKGQIRENIGHAAIVDGTIKKALPNYVNEPAAQNR